MNGGQSHGMIYFARATGTERRASVSEPDHSTPEATFAVGDRVRVRRGVADPDFPDLPIGGWAGTVIQVDAHTSPTSYLVRWSRETLLAIHPVYDKRATRNGLGVGEMYLEPDDLEPDDGTPVGIEQPTNIVVSE